MTRVLSFRCRQVGAAIGEQALILDSLCFIPQGYALPRVVIPHQGVRPGDAVQARRFPGR